MSEILNAVIETNTGNLLRQGFCDFENDGSFNSGTETYMVNIPRDLICIGTENETQHSCWNGSAWVLVTP